MMKKIYLLIAVTVTYGLNAQYTQNFDALTAGDYIGVKDANWTTWSGGAGVGTSEDAQINNTQSNSGSNSIYFSAPGSTGGPQDVVLAFGAAHNSGQFVYEHKVYVSAGKLAYFNFQAESTVGITWAMDVNFQLDSTISISQQNVEVSKANFLPNTWVTFKLAVNLSTNVWETFVNGVSIGSFQNAENKLASVNFYPIAGSEFWIDDVNFSHTPYILPNLNGAIYYINVGRVAIDGANSFPSVKIRNLGTTTINSFDLTLSYNGTQITETMNTANFPPLYVYDFKFSSPIMISKSAGSISATISNVNGGTADNDPTDDTKTVDFKPIIPAPGKVVIVEEATGTWCGWCPRGTVAMEFLARDYPGFAQGIAVHNGDPMANSIYDAGIGGFISGYPSALVERKGDMDPSAIFADVNTALQQTPAGILVNGARFDPVTRLLEVSVTTTFNSAISNGWRMACAITEDSVTGTTSQYAQENYYATGTSLVGPDGIDWASRPRTVPASEMVYNHVARAISPSFAGELNSLAGGAQPNDVVTTNFWFPIDTSWNKDNIHIVGMLIKPSGQIENGSSSTIAGAISKGFVSGNNVSVTKVLLGPDAKVRLFPNPTQQGYTIIEINQDASFIDLSVVNTAGKEIFAKTVTNHQSQDLIELNTQNWSEGIYIVNVKGEKFTESHKLIVE